MCPPSGRSPPAGPAPGNLGLPAVRSPPTPPGRPRRSARPSFRRVPRGRPEGLRRRPEAPGGAGRCHWEAPARGHRGGFTPSPPSYSSRFSVRRSPSRRRSPLPRAQTAAPRGTPGPRGLIRPSGRYPPENTEPWRAARRTDHGGMEGPAHDAARPSTLQGGAPTTGTHPAAYPPECASAHIPLSFPAGSREPTNQGMNGWIISAEYLVPIPSAVTRHIERGSTRTRGTHPEATEDHQETAGKRPCVAARRGTRSAGSTTARQSAAPPRADAGAGDQPIGHGRLKQALQDPIPPPRSGITPHRSSRKRLPRAGLNPLFTRSLRPAHPANAECLPSPLYRSATIVTQVTSVTEPPVI